VGETKERIFLVIEDNADDAALIRRAFSSVESCQAFICRNISEAKAYIQGAGMYKDRDKYPFPNGVICDLHLSGESGMDFVTWLKLSSEYRDMPVTILTGSEAAKDFLVARRLGSVDILTKPSRFEDLKTMLADLAAKLCT
jgi:CheY-like chemotaxis protein